MLEPTLELIDLPIAELRYQKFVSAFVYKGEEGTFLYDTGPACTIPILLKALEDRGIDHLDWILMSHIHIDHGGGIGHVIKKFPDAKIVCHEKAVRHLIDPTRLWEGSLRIHKHEAEVYGPILPVQEESIHVLDEVPFGDGIRVIDTPGHASHHQCFVFRDWLFCGELYGIHLHLDKDLYLRPATPARFVLEDHLESMDKCDRFSDKKIVFGHWGVWEDGEEVMQKSRRQLLLWVDVLEQNLKEEDFSKLTEVLLEQDEVLALMEELEPHLYERERHFAKNSINGIVQYLRTK
jgi:glyoxylase-like metal-dependent hydrolase (beta-lactamase superfamily II)